MRRCVIAVSIFLLVTNADATEPTATADRTLGKRCGYFAMASVIGAFDLKYDHDELSRQLPDHPEGSSLAELREAAMSRGLTAEGVQFATSLPEFSAGTICVVLPVKSRTSEPHFVVAMAATSQAISVFDYPQGLFFLDEKMLRARYGWDGTALVIARSKREVERMLVPPTMFWIWIVGGAICLGAAAVLWRFMVRGQNS